MCEARACVLRLQSVMRLHFSWSSFSSALLSIYPLCASMDSPRKNLLERRQTSFPRYMPSPLSDRLHCVHSCCRSAGALVHGAHLPFPGFSNTYNQKPFKSVGCWAKTSCGTVVSCMLQIQAHQQPCIDQQDTSKPTIVKRSPKKIKGQQGRGAPAPPLLPLPLTRLTSWSNQQSTVSLLKRHKMAYQDGVSGSVSEKPCLFLPC
jgi:hypothetical protein